VLVAVEMTGFCLGGPPASVCLAIATMQTRGAVESPGDARDLALILFLYHRDLCYSFELRNPVKFLKVAQ
jgi:hypothetical protein